MPPTKRTKEDEQLSRREREILSVVTKLGSCTVKEVVEHLANPPSYDSVRVLMALMKKKNLLKGRRSGRQHVFSPTARRDVAQRKALKQVVSTFFSSSPSQAIIALVDQSASRMSDQELEEISELIEKAKSKRSQES